MQSRRAAILVLLPLLAWPGSTSASPLQYGEAVIGAVANARMGSDRDRLDDDGSAIPPEEVFAHVEVLATEGPSFARVETGGTAMFGEYEGDIGASFEIDIVMETEGPGSADAYVEWLLELTPDVDGMLSVDYEVAGDGGWTFRTFGGSTMPLVGSGTLTRALVADQFFGMYIVGTAVASCSVACDYHANGYGDFRYMIVPEPSTLALVAAGMLALALRRRGRPSCAAS